MLRYLRIAAAVVLAIVGWSLVALWVRSHYRADSLHQSFGPHGTIELHSHRGVAGLLIELGNDDMELTGGWRLTSAAVDPEPSSGSGFSLALDSQPAWATAPHWFLAACSFGLAALFAFKRTWRFTVRGLLIATTVLAAILGLAVYVV
jgi:hypothetical protein